MTIKDMLGRSGVVSREEALKALDEHLAIPDLRPEDIPLRETLGRVLARDILSPSDHPEFDRSTMDGYAVRSADTFGAAESHPALLTVIGDIPMGTMPDRTIGKGECMKIATGGALPQAADAVVMFEHVQAVDAATIEVVKPVGPRDHVISAGDDLKKGERVLPKGQVLRPQDMSILASIGVATVPVFEKPRVAIISTGNEIVSADSLPGPGQIRDSNSYNLEGLITLAGGTTRRMGIIPDNEDRLRTTLLAAMTDCHIVLFSGGSSVGTADFTAKVINDIGSPGVLVHGISIKPGKPLIVGIVKRRTSGEHIPVFGLPGHPAAVAICFELFVKPVLALFTGAVMHPALTGIYLGQVVKAKLSRSVPSAPGREDHVRVMLERRDDGLWAKPVFGASGLISTLVKAVGTVVIPKNAIGIETGEEVEVRLF
ncbi:MAG: molybdopterin molybdotransferase MoeA [Nitrospirota bacterium]|nr:molybdopterin molybdotransferase MoeA [Nitrospirota bacterium]